MIRELSLLVAVIVLSMQTVGASPQTTTAQQQTIPNEHWTDPDTGLMWAGRDSGKDLSWKGALKYCRNLRLSGFSDWRLPDVFELQRIFDKTVEAPGMAGQRSEEPTTWHVKGRLFLTAEEWSSSFIRDDRGHDSGYVYYFDFNEGKPNDDPTGWPYPHQFRRALCVRSPSSPLGTHVP